MYTNPDYYNKQHTNSILLLSSNRLLLLQLDFWTYPNQPGKPVDIHVPHNSMREFKHALKKKAISFRIKIRNLQRLINGERMRFRSVPFNGAFHTYAQVNKNFQHYRIRTNWTIDVSKLFSCILRKLLKSDYGSFFLRGKHFLPLSWCSNRVSCTTKGLVT